MAAPIIEFRQFSLGVSDTAINTPLKRVGALTGDNVIDDGGGGGAELDFGIVDISSGAADSALIPARLLFTNNSGNTLVEDFELFLLTADYGFTLANTDVNMTEDGIGSSADTNANTQLWDDTSPDIASYTWSELSPTETGTLNLRPAGTDGTSIDITTLATTDDGILWVNYIHVEILEETGTYKAADAGKQFRYSLTYSYS